MEDGDNVMCFKAMEVFPMFINICYDCVSEVGEMSSIIQIENEIRITNALHR